MPQLLAVPGIGYQLARAIRSAPRTSRVDPIIECCREHQVQIWTPGDSRYPELLREIHDPPGILFARGQEVSSSLPRIAIVGMRRPSPYGLRTAYQLALELAETGFTIVSGLARGIDGAAHRGALAAGGRTLAILGSGVLRIYPSEHAKLAASIRQQGTLLSEFAPRTAPARGAFPRRNRLISGLSLAVIVVEAAERSGALISARHAADQGRDVLAVPGRIDSHHARGCHLLLKDGAALVESTEDVLQALGPTISPPHLRQPSPCTEPKKPSLNARQQKILELVNDEATSIDLVVQRSGFTTGEVLATISTLEMHQYLERVGGHYVARRPG